MIELATHLPPLPNAARARLFALLGVCAAVLVVHFDTVGTLVHIWQTSNAHSFGWLVAPLALGIAFGARHAVAAAPMRLSALGVGVLVVLTAVWVLAKLMDVQVAQQLALVMLLGAALWAVAGFRVAWLLAFPVGYLLLATPVLSLAVPLLQQLTANVSVYLLRNLGVPVFHDGFYISIPNGDFVVADVCSGLNYLLATLCITLLLSWNNRRHRHVALLIAVGGVAVALVLNWLRVVVIILAGHIWGMDFPLVSQHVTFGWILFGLGLLAMCLFVESCTRRLERRAQPEAPVEVPESLPGAGAPRLLAHGCVALLVVAIGPVAASYLADRAAALPVDESARVAAVRVPGWGAPVPLARRWDTDFPGAQVEQHAYLAGEGGAQVATVVAFYPQQSEGRELVSELARLHGDEWKLVRRGVVEAPCGPARADELQLRRGLEDRVVWAWYYSGGRFTASAVGAKLGGVEDLLRGRQGAARVLVGTRVDGDLAQARAMLGGFCSAFEAPLEAAIAAAATSEGEHRVGAGQVHDSREILVTRR